KSLAASPLQSGLASLSLTLLLHLRPPPQPGRRGGAPPASRLITHLHPSIGAASHDHLHHGPPAPYHPSCQPPAPSHPRRGRPDKVSGAPRD
uniref:Uncharacterized protein n=1 Tax=Aegilops tauschii subsp. strangulata TaxID=200361 RepID=A0A453BFW2_AEGTS